MADAPKIIFDDDWKAQAQKEREKLVAQEKEAAAKAGPGKGSGLGSGGVGAAGAAGGSGEGDPHAMPPADFQSLIGTLITQALMYMGGFPDPETGRAMVSLDHARFHIDLLGVLEQKTKGNLAPEEASDLSQALNELRLRFVDITKAVAEMQAQKLAGGGMGGLGLPGGVNSPGAAMRGGSGMSF